VFCERYSQQVGEVGLGPADVNVAKIWKRGARVLSSRVKHFAESHRGNLAKRHRRPPLRQFVSVTRNAHAAPVCGSAGSSPGRSRRGGSQDADLAKVLKRLEIEVDLSGEFVEL